MAYLGDYLGHLMAEVTMARVQADLEAVRIAEMYATHPLLKNMPVPRFRLPVVEIDVPVVINKMEESKPGEIPRGTPGITEMRKSFDLLFTKTLREERIRLSADQRKKIKSIIDKEVEKIKQPGELAVSVNHIADKLAMISANALKETGVSADTSKISHISSKLKLSGRLEFQTLRKPPSRLDILATTSAIKEAGPKESITTLRLKIDEEAYEWTSIETEDGTKDQLVIE